MPKFRMYVNILYFEISKFQNIEYYYDESLTISKDGEWRVY